MQPPAPQYPGVMQEDPQNTNPTMPAPQDPNMGGVLPPGNGAAGGEEDFEERLRRLKDM